MTVEFNGRNRASGVKKIFSKSITSATNAGDVTVATITNNNCLIKSITLLAYTAAPAQLTSAGIFGGASKVVTFIAALDALQADLDAADKQVSWQGSVALVATKTIVISLVGAAGGTVDFYVIVEYEPIGAGGYLL